jgi:hypothetical protein
VHQVIQQLIPDGPGQSFIEIPAMEAIELDEFGGLHARLQPNAARPVAGALGDLLRQLSAGIGRPPALRLFAMRAISATPPVSLEDFSRELNDWAPPDCRERLVRLYDRARRREKIPVGAAVPQRAPLDVRRLTTRAAAALVVVAVVLGAVKIGQGLAARKGQEPPQPKATGAPAESGASVDVAVPPQSAPIQPSAQQKSQQGDSSQRTAHGDYILPPDPFSVVPKSSAPRAAGSIAAPPVASARAQARGPQNRQPAASAVANRTHAQAGPSAATNPAQARPAARPSSAGRAGSTVPVTDRADVVTIPGDSNKAAEVEFRRARNLFDQHEYAAAAEGFAHVLKMVPASDDGGTSLRFMANQYLELTRASLQATQARVYTRDDEGVTEPVARGQFLPAPPDPSTPPNRLATLELVIDTRGNVESVRLSGESSQYRTGWWVSAAKAWRFRPAVKDGRPVKFLKRIAVADSKPLEPR